MDLHCTKHLQLSKKLSKEYTIKHWSALKSEAKKKLRCVNKGAFLVVALEERKIKTKYNYSKILKSKTKSNSVPAVVVYNFESFQ